MRTKHTDGNITFTPDAYEKRCADTVTDMATTISVLATGDVEQQAKEVTVGIAKLMVMIAEKPKAEPESPEDAAHKDAEKTAKDQSP